MAENEDAQITITEEALKKAKETTDKLSANVLNDLVISLNESKLKLLFTIKDLKQQNIQLKQDQADVYFYLNKKCDDAFEVIASLEEQLVTEQTDREITEKIYEKKVLDLQSAVQNTEARMQGRIRELEDKLAQLKEFGDKKVESEKLLQNLMETLDVERKQFIENSQEIERRWLLDREKLKKDYALKEVSLRQEMQAKVTERLSHVTKKTYFRNESLQKELTYQVRLN